MSIHVSFKHVLCHEMSITPRVLACVPWFHIYLNWSKTGGLVNIVHVITMGSKMKKLSHANRTLVSNHFTSSCWATCVSWSSQIRYWPLNSLYLYWLLLIRYLACSDDFCLQLRSMDSMMNDSCWLWGNRWLLRLCNSLDRSYSWRKNHLGRIFSNCYILYWSRVWSNRSYTSNVVYLMKIENLKPLILLWFISLINSRLSIEIWSHYYLGR